MAGTAADRPAAQRVVIVGGYRVIAADFHLHSSMWSDGALTPWGLVLEARRQGLDAIAITGHNEILDGRIARWFSAWIGGPTVFIGQEVLNPAHHLIAVGISQVVDWRLPVSQALEEIHRQGGVGIAAHPIEPFWPGFDAAAMALLDGAEICHPIVYRDARHQRDLERFAARGPVAAIGSSDFHGIGRLGECRTFVFASGSSAAAILEAIRARRTVVYGRGGKAYGDPALVALLKDVPALVGTAASDSRTSSKGLDWVSRIAGLLGFAAAILAYRTCRATL